MQASDLLRPVLVQKGLRLLVMGSFQRNRKSRSGVIWSGDMHELDVVMAQPQRRSYLQ